MVPPATRPRAPILSAAPSPRQPLAESTAPIHRSMDGVSCFHTVGYKPPPPVRYCRDGRGARDSWIAQTPRDATVVERGLEGVLSPEARFWRQRLQQRETRGKFAHAAPGGVTRADQQGRKRYNRVPEAARFEAVELPRLPRTPQAPAQRILQEKRNKKLADDLSQQLGVSIIPT